MKKIRYSVIAVALVTTVLLQFLTTPEEGTKNEAKLIYDEVKKADKPDIYLSIDAELKTKPGYDGPDYPLGYRFKELQKSKNQSSLFRLEEAYDFIERGPANVPGRTRGLVVDPDDPTYKTWFAGGVGGGIWKTIDGGESWQEQSSDIPNLSISWIVMAESDHNIMYAGTGEGWGGSSNFIKGNGILKSTDHGTSWSPISSTIDNPDFEIINRIVVDPNNANIVLAATSTDRRFNPNPSSSIYKSIDGGDTWTKKYESATYVQQIVADPNDFNNLLAAESSQGALKSIDAGETWVESSNGMLIARRIELAISPVNSQRVYASAQGELSGTGSDLYFSDDAGINWNLAVNQSGEVLDFLGGQGWYDNTILAHPFNKDEVYVGAVNFWKFKVFDENINLGKTFVGADEENTESFLDLTSFNSGIYYDGKIASENNVQENFISVEIRFGPDGSGSYLKQMAHRFTVPDGRGSGVVDTDYSYEDYVEVPFQVWDIENDRQLMVAFRDQQKDDIYNLLYANGDNDDWQNNAREYLYISDITYNESTPDASMATDGGHIEGNLYFLWPFLPANQTWDPSSFPEATFRIRFNNIEGKRADYTSVTDAYNQYSGNNRFSQTTGSTTVEGVHPDHHNIVPIIHDEDQNIFQLLLANDGGIYSSGAGTDPGVANGDWDFSGLSYNTSQFYAVDKAPGESRYIGGLQDNGTWMSGPDSGSPEAMYRRVNGGDGFGTAWNYANKSEILTTIYYNRIEKSRNEGSSSTVSTSGLNDVGSGLGPFVTELEYYQADPEVVYAAGVSGVWKSEDFGDNWTLAPIETNWRLFSTMYVRISLANPNIVWAGTGMSSSYSFQASIDGGNSFSSVENYQEYGRASGFATHPVLDSTAFALFSYSNSSKILRTDDLGKTWHDISGFESGISTKGFPNVSVRDLLVMPNDTSTIWAATEIGIFETIDSGESWHILTGNLPAVPVWDIKIVDKEVVLGTHGRGIWSIEIEDLTGHVYIPEIISTTPTLLGEPTFNFKALSSYDSVLLFVNSERINRMDDVDSLTINNIPAPGVTSKSGNAYVRAFRDGRPFVSKSFAYSVDIYEPSIDSYSNNFEEETNDFIGSGFTITSYGNFAGKAIHSEHFYTNNALYQYILKSPIKVKANNALINFNEVVLVEPGVANSMPGSIDFKDYVSIQGSLDGLNWIDLTDPYDASANSSWEASFGPTGVGSENLFAFRSIDLQDNFETGDEVILRFLLRSDSDIIGWGWIIDNLKIQTSTVITGLVDQKIGPEFEIYPNPVEGNVLKLNSRHSVVNGKLQIISLTGQLEFEYAISGEKIDVNLPPNIQNGYHLIKIESSRASETYRLLIRR